MFITFTCIRWSTEFLDVDPIEENKLGRYHKRMLLFFLPGWYMPHFHLLPFVINKRYGEGEMSRVVVFFISYNLILHLLFSLWKSVDHDQPLLNLSVTLLLPLTLNLCYLLYFLLFIIFGRSLLKDKLTVVLLSALSPCV